jgi:hypothetical protein
LGCLLGDTSYVTGRFPGHNRVAIRIFEPSEVKVSLFLTEATAAGKETVINFWEDRCRARSREVIDGRALLGETERLGFLERKAELAGTGDHMIEVDSDAHANYFLKVDVLPLRLRDLGEDTL